MLDTGVKAKPGERLPDEQIAYINGGEGNEPNITLRLDNLKKGEYYVLYRPDFKTTHKVRKINIVFYSEFMQKQTAAMLAAIAAQVKRMAANISEESLLPNSKPRAQTAQRERPVSALSQ